VTSVDTNILIRFFTRDDEKQARRAASLIQKNEIWIAKTVVLETECVLRNLYDFSKSEVLAALRSLSGLENVHLEDPANVIKAFEWAAGDLDFADALHIASAQDAPSFATLDDKLAKRAKRITGVNVVTV
jgi:predicted nucleic-acid-binding protein